MILLNWLKAGDWMKPRVLVSLCLLGIECRYDGGSNAAAGMEALKRRCELIPLCPEQLGGLPTPRPPSERRGERVVTRDGSDVTAAFRRGADQACRLAAQLGARYALLKARSPSCGTGAIYDGRFSGTLTRGDGLTAQMLRAMGLQLFDETQIDDLICKLEEDDAYDTV